MYNEMPVQIRTQCKHTCRLEYSVLILEYSNNKILTNNENKMNKTNMRCCKDPRIENYILSLKILQ